MPGCVVATLGIRPYARCHNDSICRRDMKIFWNKDKVFVLRKYLAFFLNCDKLCPNDCVNILGAIAISMLAPTVEYYFCT